MNKKNLRASAFILAIAVAWMISGFFAPGEPKVFEPEVKNQKVITVNSVAQNFSLPITVKGESQAFSKVDIKANTVTITGPKGTEKIPFNELTNLTSSKSVNLF